MTGLSTVVGIIPLVIGSGAGYESRVNNRYSFNFRNYFFGLIDLIHNSILFKILDEKKIRSTKNYLV